MVYYQKFLDVVLFLKEWSYILSSNKNSYTHRSSADRYLRNARKKTQKKKKPKLTINLAKIGLFLIAVAITAGIGYAVYTHMPGIRLDKAIASGDKLAQEADYEAAIEAYSEAIAIDSTSVKAYSNMAGAYLSIDDIENAKATLMEGYQNTQDKSLLDNYHVIVLNQAVAQMNNQTADMDTVLLIASVLEADGSNSDAVKLLKDAYERVFESNYGYDKDAFFRADSDTYSSENGSKTYSYEQYEKLINDLMSIYAASPTMALKDCILLYAVPNLSSFTMDLDDAASYLTLLENIESTIGTSDTIASMKECLTDQQNVSGIFADIFAQLDVGNVDELRDFVVSSNYIALRDTFLKGQYTPQENTTYIPISREAIILNSKDGKWSYRFLNFEENPGTDGVITLWANFFEDNGVQRSVISYEPKTVGESYYPHTQYTVTYLKSYTTSGNSTKVAKMNYRLDTTIETSEDNIDETIIGDWGGPDEWIMDIDTIESRIKA